MKKIKYLIPAIALMFGLASCDNMDELYKDHKADYSVFSTQVKDLSATSGFKRSMLTWNNSSRDIAKTMKISYNNGENVIEIDSIVSSYVVEGLNSGTYTFEVSTFDKWGNESLPATKTVRVYGDKDAELMQRPVVSIKYDAKKKTHILKFGNVSTPLAMWGGKMEYTITGPDGVTTELNTSLNKTFNQYEWKKVSWTTKVNGKDVTMSAQGYYSRAIDLTVNLGLLPAGEYRVDYTSNAFPGSFANNAQGYVFYTAVAMDAIEFTDSANLVVEEVPAE